MRIPSHTVQPSNSNQRDLSSRMRGLLWHLLLRFSLLLKARGGKRNEPGTERYAGGYLCSTGFPLSLVSFLGLSTTEPSVVPLKHSWCNVLGDSQLLTRRWNQSGSLPSHRYASTGLSFFFISFIQCFSTYATYAVRGIDKKPTIVIIGLSTLLVSPYTSYCFISSS